MAHRSTYAPKTHLTQLRTSALRGSAKARKGAAALALHLDNAIHLYFQANMLHDPLHPSSQIITPDALRRTSNIRQGSFDHKRKVKIGEAVGKCQYCTRSWGLQSATSRYSGERPKELEAIAAEHFN
jgi:hypothetical protein